MSTELIAISTTLPKVALQGPLGTRDDALAVMHLLTDQPVSYKGVKKLDSVLVGARPHIGVGTYGDSIVVVANDLPALTLDWDELRRQRTGADFYVIGHYSASSGVEILHQTGDTTVRHYSVTDDEIEHDEGKPLPFEEEGRSLTLTGLEDLYKAAPESHRRVEADGTRYLLDAEDKLVGRVNAFEIDSSDQTWIPVDADTLDDPDEEQLDTDALADAAVQAWFGFELLDAPKHLKTHVFKL